MSLAALLETAVRALRSADIPFMLTGSVAAFYHGVPRATQDIDVVIDAPWNKLERLVAELQRAGLYTSAVAAREALENEGQFNAIDVNSGWKVDFIVRKSRPFSESEFGRRIPVELLEVEVATATVEDLMIAKLEWSRLGDSERQRRDVAELLEVAGGSVDLAYVDRWTDALGLKEEWQRIRAQQKDSNRE